MRALWAGVLVAIWASLAQSPLHAQTLTGDWFGQGPAMRDAGIDLRVEWSQFFQGMTRGAGDRDWKDGSKIDARLRVDLSKWGAWNGLSVTAQGNWAFGNSVNGYGGTAIPVNGSLYFPGIEGKNAYDLMALYVTQNFGVVSLSVGKLNLVEFARGVPLRGGGGVDAFWNVALSSPITGYTPPEIYGALLTINTQPVSYTLTVFDAQDASNKKLFSNMFDEGVNVMGTATYATKIAGLSGFYTVKGIYSTGQALDLSRLPLPPLPIPLNKKDGGWFVSGSFQQYLVQDPANPKRGWGVFGEFGKSDGNPDIVSWSTYIGVGGSSFVPGRDNDRFGVAYFRYGVADFLRDALNPFIGIDDESGIEAFYNVAVTPWFRVTANVQFIRPAFTGFPRATFAGLGTSVRF